MTPDCNPILVLGLAVFCIFVVHIAITIVGLRVVLDDREIVLPFAFNLPHIPQSLPELRRQFHERLLAGAATAVRMCIGLGQARVAAAQPILAARRLASDNMPTLRVPQPVRPAAHYQTLGERIRAQQAGQRSAA